MEQVSEAKKSTNESVGSENHALSDPKNISPVNQEDPARISEGERSSDTNEDQKKIFIDAGSSSTDTSPVTTTSDVQQEEDFTIFHCVSYLGAATIKEPRSETEIHKVMAFLNEQPVENLIQVSVSVPLYSNGNVVVYEEHNQLEISRFGVNQIIFFARGLSATPDWACFAFTCSHGQTLDAAIFQCHVFRCDVPEAVARVFSTFARTFSSPPKIPIRKTSDSSSEVPELSNGDKQLESKNSVLFEVSLEIKEDDGKGNYSSVPRDKGFFKLRSGALKHIVLTVQQLPNPTKDLIVERCFGLLLSPGRHVRHSDMQLVEMLSWSIGSHSQGSKTYVITGQWDSNDPAFESLNQETAKESHVFFTVAVDLVIRGIQEPIRFSLEAKAKIYPITERFWMIVRKCHLTQQFLLLLQQTGDDTSGDSIYKVLSNTAVAEVDRNRMNFNLNFTSFIRSTSSDLGTPTREEPDDSDDDEPLQSGTGMEVISKHCTDEQLASWGDLVINWPATATSRPKQLTTLVRDGIPDTVRGEIWQRLSGCHYDEAMMKNYQSLLSKECKNEEIILRDITRTFPANDFFRESGGAGQEQLYRISKAYSVYDLDVGYCQGISFIAAALLLQMPEEQSFCLLVKIMFEYGFRELYLDGFENLRLKLFQLDKLVEDQIPELWAHFRELGVESHMYANQWFLTLYTAKFPLVFVFRVLDVFLLDGTKVLFQIALSLLSAARKDLLMLDFEGCLKYFRVSLPKKFRNQESTNNLLRVAFATKVKRLKRYEAEYATIKENQVDPIEKQRQENKALIENMLRSEHTITNLVLGKMNAEERLAQVEDELSKTKMALREVEEFNQKLKEETNSVKELFQREVRIYDVEAEKKTTIIAEYKKICSKLSSQLEEEQKVSKERAQFFQSNLCETCSDFVSTALQIARKKQQVNGDSMTRVDSYSPISGGSPDQPSPHHGTKGDNSNVAEPLENELAKTKIALAEAECRNDDLSHQLSIAMGELEICRTNHGLSGATRIWRNLTSSNKESSRISATEEFGNGATNTGNGTITSSTSLHSFGKK